MNKKVHFARFNAQTKSSAAAKLPATKRREKRGSNRGDLGERRNAAEAKVLDASCVIAAVNSRLYGVRAKLSMTEAIKYRREPHGARLQLQPTFQDSH